MEEFVSNVDYTTKLDNFEGPLDLLLHLIREAKVEIKDIFVSKVTEQFLLYINNLDEIDILKAADYLNMAATLVEIKSKALLPKIEDFIPEEIDPEKTLIRQLEEYKLFKEAGDKLKGQENVARFYKEPDPDATDVRIVYKDFNLNGLLAAYTKMLAKIDAIDRDKNNPKEIHKDVHTVQEKVDFIVNRLLARKECYFFDLFDSVTEREEVITTFQALLELLKLQYLTVAQDGVYEDIKITLREDRSEDLGKIDEFN